MDIKTKNEQRVLNFDNDMSTPTRRALHYVHCYHLHFPNSGALDVALELLEIAQKEEGKQIRDAELNVHTDAGQDSVTPTKDTGLESKTVTN